MQPAMTWLGWLAVAVLVAAVASVTGIKPKGTRHVAHTRLMGMARLALWCSSSSSFTPQPIALEPTKKGSMR
jgi:hypothetical protein